MAHIETPNPDRGFAVNTPYAAFFRRGFGTFAPERRASDNPIAIACFGFVTLRPLPDFNLPRLNSCISLSTDCDAFGPYLRPLDFLAEDFFAVDFFPDDRFVDELALVFRPDDLVPLLREEPELDFLLLLFFEDEDLERDLAAGGIRFGLPWFRRNL